MYPENAQTPSREDLLQPLWVLTWENFVFRCLAVSLRLPLLPDAEVLLPNSLHSSIGDVPRLRGGPVLPPLALLPLGLTSGLTYRLESLLTTPLPLPGWPTIGSNTVSCRSSAVVRSPCEWNGCDLQLMYVSELSTLPTSLRERQWPPPPADDPSASDLSVLISTLSGVRKSLVGYGVRCSASKYSFTSCIDTHARKIFALVKQNLLIDRSVLILGYRQWRKLLGIINVRQCLNFNTIITLTYTLL